VVRKVRTESPQTESFVAWRASAKLGALSLVYLRLVSVQAAESTGAPSRSRAFASWPTAGLLDSLLARQRRVFTASRLCTLRTCVCARARDIYARNIRDGRNRPIVYTCRRRIGSEGDRGKKNSQIMEKRTCTMDS